MNNQLIFVPRGAARISTQRGESSNVGGAPSIIVRDTSVRGASPPSDSSNHGHLRPRLRRTGDTLRSVVRIAALALPAMGSNVAFAAAECGGPGCSSTGWDDLFMVAMLAFVGLVLVARRGGGISPAIMDAEEAKKAAKRHPRASGQTVQA